MPFEAFFLFKINFFHACDIIIKKSEVIMENIKPSLFEFIRGEDFWQNILVVESDLQNPVFWIS